MLSAKEENTAAAAWRIDERRQVFVLVVEGRESYIRYSLQPPVISLQHTYVPEALAGRGLGGILVQKSLEYIARQEWKFIPLCPFIKSYTDRHPAWKSFVAEGYGY